MDLYKSQLPMQPPQSQLADKNLHVTFSPSFLKARHPLSSHFQKKQKIKLEPSILKYVIAGPWFPFLSIVHIPPGDPRQELWAL